MNPISNKVIIIGCSGFIGNSLYNYLSSNSNFDVVGFSSINCNLLNYDQVEYALKNIKDETSIVFVSFIGPKQDNTIDSFTKNVQMVTNFVNVITDKQIKSIIFISSTDIYGMPALQLPITENTGPNIIDFYSLSKYTCENIFFLKLSAKCPITSLRLPGIYGYNDNGNSIIGHFVKNIFYGNKCIINNNGNSFRDFVSVSDLSKIICELLIKPSEGIINVCTGNTTSIKEIVLYITDCINKEVQIEFSEKFTKRDYDLSFDSTKLKRSCPDLSMQDIKSGIDEYIKDLTESKGKKNG